MVVFRKLSLTIPVGLDGVRDLEIDLCSVLWYGGGVNIYAILLLQRLFALLKKTVSI